jgi:hypothetical protein
MTVECPISDIALGGPVRRRALFSRSSRRRILLGVVFSAADTLIRMEIVGDFRPRSIWLTYVR